MKNKNPIIAQPLGGLCNRMRVITGAAKLAKALNQELVVIWTSDKTLNAKFSDLFEPIPHRVIDVPLGSTKQRMLWHWYKDICRYTIIDDAWIHEHARTVDCEGWKEKVEGKKILINANTDILVDGDYSIFQPKLGICEIADKSGVTHNTIGIHIRRTDNEKAVKYSPTSLFIDRIKADLEVTPDRQYYLATDDPKEESVFLEEFGEKIVVFKKQSLDRNNPLAIKEALVDLYNLSRCEKIYGSYYSSFSDIAAWWRGIEKEVIATNN